MIKDVLVHLPSDASGLPSEAVTNFAVSLADTFKAYLFGVAFTYEPMLAAFDGAGMPVEFIKGLSAESKRRADAATGAFDQAARRAGLSVASRILASSPAGASSLFSKIARRFDLAIVGQAKPDNVSVAASDSIIEAALFESGRPVLLIPYIQRKPLQFNRVMVCWDGSRAAARAIADGIPFLARATAIDVISVESEEIRSEEDHSLDISQHFARHSLNVEVRRIVTNESVFNTILSQAADTSADLIIMGGYGHSRLREFILGGVTRGILATMTVPTLMAH